MPAPVAAAAAAPWVAPAIMAGGAALQGIVTSAFNAREAEKNRDFQERMSNTAHQREINDLRAAGLNPILSAKLGGSSTPGGSSAQANSPDVAHAGIQGFLAKQQVALQDAQIKDVTSASKLKDAEAGDIQMTQLQRIGLLKAQIRDHLQSADYKDLSKLNLSQELKNLTQLEQKLLMETTHSALDIDRSRRESEFHRGVGGKLSPYMRFNPLGNTGINFLRLKH